LFERRATGRDFLLEGAVLQNANCLLGHLHATGGRIVAHDIRQRPLTRIHADDGLAAEQAHLPFLFGLFEKVIN